MTTKDMTCPKCHGQMEISDDKQYIVCPLCEYKELIEESEAIHAEKIRSQERKEIEQEKGELEIKKKRLEIRHSILVQYKILFIPLAVVAVLLVCWGVYSLIHINQIQPKMSPKDYIGDNAFDVEAELKDAGFTNIQLIEKSDLKMSDSSSFDTVEQIVINGTTEFGKRTWFYPDAPVIIKYHTLDPARKNDIQVPEGSSSYIDRKYSSVIESLKSAGFANIETIPKEDLDMSQKSKCDLVMKISIGDNSSFKKGTWFEKNSPVIITYHSIDPERANDIQIPESNTAYEGLGHNTVVQKLKTAGFTNIEIQAVYDIGLFSKEKVGVVEKVIINGQREYVAGTWFANDSLIIVYYHEKSSNMDPDEQVKTVARNDIILSFSSKDLKGKPFQEVADFLATEGFCNIDKKGLGDLKKGWLHKDGAVDSITIDGDSKFKKGSVYANDVEIIILYHSYEEA